jgi:hypothetical protein
LHATKVGDTFEIQGGVLAAASPSEIQELAKAVKAGDKEGEQKMLDDGTIEWLPKGSTVRILEIVKPTYAQAFRGERKSPYAECRLIRRGKASGKKYVLLFQFNDSDMKPLKP